MKKIFMHEIIDKKFGEWKVLEYAGIISGKRHYICICSCGFRKAIAGTKLKRGETRKCKKCNNREILGNQKGKNNNFYKHGFSDTATYNIWLGILERCLNASHQNYKRYGGRGIKVCDRWRSFINFFADMGERPKGLQIDRINNDGDYEPSNCRWVTPKENMNNRSNSKKIRTYNP